MICYTNFKSWNNKLVRISRLEQLLFSKVGFIQPSSNRGCETSTLYTTFRVLYSPFYQAAMQAYLLCTIEEKSWAQMNKNTLFLV